MNLKIAIGIAAMVMSTLTAAGNPYTTCQFKGQVSSEGAIVKMDDGSYKVCARPSAYSPDDGALQGTWEEPFKTKSSKTAKAKQ
jgi:hypothetical protein